MFKLLCILALCVSLVFLAHRACAQTSYLVVLPELVRDADLICVGTIDATPSPDDPDSAHITILQTIKGKAFGSSIFVIHLKGVAFPVPLERGLFFLKGDDTSQFYTFVNQFRPAMSLGRSPQLKTIANLGPFRTTVLTLAQALATSDEENRVQLLYSLAQARLIQQPKAPSFIRLAKNLGEDGGFRQFFIDKVLPLIAPLDDDPDLRVRVRALNLQAMFQDATVLPILMHIVESGGNMQNTPDGVELAVSALGYYDTLATAPVMLHALSSPISNIRRAALGSLANTLGRKATPLLIDRLRTTKDLGEQDSIIWQLSQVTGEMNPFTHDYPVQTHRQEYVDYWEHWETTHKDEIARDRAQLAALAKN